MKTILVLSTDKGVSEQLKEKLTYPHFNLKTVKDPNNIFRSIEKFRPDLLLIDFILQDGNGGSICHQIKCNPETRTLPVVILTEHASSFAFFKKFGCDDIIEKPFDSYLLFSKINRCLKTDVKTPASKTSHRDPDAGRTTTFIH
jgi:DNA-binding response OmpR family regulator